MVLTYSKLIENRKELQEELAKLQAYNLTSPRVPITRKLVEFEIDRIQELLSGMEIDDIHKDVDGDLMINQLWIHFDLSDSNSAEQLCEKLISEHKILTRRFQQSLRRIIKLILKVVNYLKQEISRMFMATTSLGPKPASEIEGQGSSGDGGGGSSPQKDETLAVLDNIKRCIDEAIDTAKKSNPQDFCGDQVIEILRKTSPVIMVDHEDIRKIIFMKCSEAVEYSGDLKSSDDEEQVERESKDD